MKYVQAISGLFALIFWLTYGLKTYYAQRKKEITDEKELDAGKVCLACGGERWVEILGFLDDPNDDRTTRPCFLCNAAGAFPRPLVEPRKPLRELAGRIRRKHKREPLGDVLDDVVNPETWAPPPCSIPEHYEPKAIASGAGTIYSGVDRPTRLPSAEALLKTQAAAREASEAVRKYSSTVNSQLADLRRDYENRTATGDDVLREIEVARRADALRLFVENYRRTFSPPRYSITTELRKLFPKPIPKPLSAFCFRCANRLEFLKKLYDVIGDGEGTNDQRDRIELLDKELRDCRDCDGYDRFWNAR